MKKNEFDLYMVVEIPKHSSNKIEYNKVEKRYELDRVLAVSMSYPEEYGVIEETLAPDGDELDVICLTTLPTYFGVYIPVRIIGILKMVDDGEEDDKILAVNAAEPRLNNIKKLSDVSQEKLAEISNFFLRYKELEKKEVVIKGFKDEKEAQKVLKKCRQSYQNHRDLIKKEKNKDS